MFEVKHDSQCSVVLIFVGYIHVVVCAATLCPPRLVSLIQYPFPDLADSFFCLFPFLCGGKKKKALALYLLLSRRFSLLQGSTEP